MKTIRKKILVAGIAIMISLATLVSVTYAWFSLNDSSWVDDFNVKIQTTESLLISCDGVSFKESISQDDVVEAINLTNHTNIKSLRDLKIQPVTTLDGVDFYEQQMSLAIGNQRTISYVKAENKSFIKFRLYFSVMAGGSEDDHKEYDLHFKTTGEEGLAVTSFTSNDQTFKLLNSLTTLKRTDSGYEVVNKKTGDDLTTSLVNSLRVCVKGSDYTNIYEMPSDNDLGSYAVEETALAKLKESGHDLVDDIRYNSKNNAMFTYYNNIHGDCMKAMGSTSEEEVVTDIESLKGLFSKLQADMNGSLGTFSYDKATGSYNTIELQFAVWLEGFDADNIIGLSSDTINCLFTFILKERQGD